MRRRTPSEFKRAGTFEVFETKRILPRLEQENIRFRLRTSCAEIQRMDASQAAFGGTFGAGAKVTLSIHREDEEKWQKLVRELYPV